MAEGKDETADFEAWLAREIEAEKAEVRRLAKRDGVPMEAIEAMFVKLWGERAGTA